MSGTIEERLDRLEQSVARLTTLLERALPSMAGPSLNGVTPANGANGANGVTHSAPSVSENVLGRAARRAETALQDSGLEERIAGLLVRLGDSETLETIERLTVLLPQLEYAFQGLAAGPELLEEGAELLRARLLAAGEDDSQVKRRVAAVTEAAAALSQPRVLETLRVLGGSLPEARPVIEGALEGARALASVESAAALRARVSEALTTLADPDTLAALTRIAALAPDLEYAVQGLAAGPTLLEEGLELARAKLAEHGLDSYEVGRRLASASGVLVALSRTESTAALQSFAELLPDLSPAVVAFGRASRALAQVEGREALTARLTDALVTLSSPEVLESLTRVVTLLPDVEYAVQAVAAGPALLEEGLELVRGTFEQAGTGVGVDTRLRAATSTLVALSEPHTLASLERLAGALPALEKLTGILPKLGALAENGAIDRVLELATTLAKKDNVEALQKLTDLAPELVRTLETLPNQPGTLAILAELNTAVANSAESTERVGLLGLLGALREEEVQRAAGFTIAVARTLGKSLPVPSSGKKLRSS